MYSCKFFLNLLYQLYVLFFVFIQFQLIFTVFIQFQPIRIFKSVAYLGIIFLLIFISFSLKMRALLLII